MLGASKSIITRLGRSIFYNLESIIDGLELIVWLQDLKVQKPTKPDISRKKVHFSCTFGCLNAIISPLMNAFIETNMKRLSYFACPLVFLLSQTVSAETYDADVWADNWFSLSVNGEQVAEDSVAITTERSFNAESFSFVATRPFVLGLLAKDFKENDTGLEYIGTRKQQMGDGGVILQVKDATGNTVAVTDQAWKCKVVHRAPVDTSCAKERNPVAGQGPCGFEISEVPAGWDTASFDDSSWAAATEHSERSVRPKDGYNRINWDSNAQLIWGADLETDNTILCRLQVE